MKVACAIDSISVRARMLAKANDIARAKAKAKEAARATNVQKCSQSHAPQVPWICGGPMNTLSTWSTPPAPSWIQEAIVEHDGEHAHTVYLTRKHTNFLRCYLSANGCGSGCCRIVITIFADNTIVYLTEKDDFGTLSEILTRWCKASHAKFNTSKTEITPLVWRNTKRTY